MTVVQRRVAVGGILVLAAGARLWGLADYPPGLYPDQAANGEDVLEILEGKLQVFSPRNNGRESFLFYVQALTVGLFGLGVWQLFLASAIVGIVTVAVAYLAGARLFGPRPALLAALFLATNPWHVTLSRTGFRAVTTPLLLSCALWSIACVLKPTGGRPRLRDAVLAGLFTGLGLYTYTAYRAFLIFLLVCGVFASVRAALHPAFRARARAFMRPVALAVGVAFLAALPLLFFFAVHPQFLGNRATHVSVFNSDLNNGSPPRTLLRMTGRTLAGFVFDGDGNPRHNVPLLGLPYRPGGSHHYSGGGAPFLSLLPALLALVGIVRAARKAPWLLALAAFMLLPAVTTAEGIPHGLRTVGAIPAHVWLAGLGGSWLLTWRRSHPWASMRMVAGVSAGFFLTLTILTDLWLYFGVAASSPLAHYEYRADLSDVSAYLNAKEQERRAQGEAQALPYLVLDDFSVQTVRVLTTPSGHPYRLLDPARSHLQLLERGEEMIFTQSTLPDASRYLEAFPGVRVASDSANRFGETTMLVLARDDGRADGRPSP